MTSIGFGLDVTFFIMGKKYCSTSAQRASGLSLCVFVPVNTSSDRLETHKSLGDGSTIMCRFHYVSVAALEATCVSAV